MKLFLVILIFLSGYSFGFNTDYKNVEIEIVKSYVFKINSNNYVRNNVLKLTYFIPQNSSYETSYIYESFDGLEKLYHDFNSNISIVQRLYYNFPSNDQLVQFLATGDMLFNSYLHVDMDVDYLDDFYENMSISVSNAVISFGLQGKDLVANNFNLDNENTAIDVDLNVPYFLNF